MIRLFTKLIVITVVTELDCSRNVARIPVMNAKTRCPVNIAIIRRSEGPAIR